MTTTTATRHSTTTATWRKTQSGEWAVCGLAAVVKAGTDVHVAKKNGEVTVEHIARVGKTFRAADGNTMVYGYLAASSSSSSSPRPHRSGRRCDECGRSGADTPARDSSGIPGMVCDRCARYPSYELSFA